MSALRRLPTASISCTKEMDDNNNNEKKKVVRVPK